VRRPADFRDEAHCIVARARETVYHERLGASRTVSSENRNGVVFGSALIIPALCTMMRYAPVRNPDGWLEL